MGIVNFGIPEQEAEWLKAKMGLNTVVEGGTYKGGTALSLSKSFKTVYTIEKSEVMFEIAKKKLDGIANIRQLQGDTREHLPKIVSESDNILFWLDAHWSGGDTYGEQDECPLLEELNIIFKSSIKNFAILIDDARLFLAPPPLPHKLENWPTIKQVASVIPDHYDMIVHDDVIFIVPASVKMPAFIQSMITSSRLRYAESGQPSLKKRIRAFFYSVIGHAGKKSFAGLG